MPYKNIQFFAYELYTGPAASHAATGGEYYLGLADDAADIQARVSLMESAMQVALAQSAVGVVAPPPGTVADKTLKVFMAPEFFFRGVRGAYPLDRVSGVDPSQASKIVEVKGIIAQLQKKATGVQWEDWVFAFGSIIAFASPAQGAEKFEVYNLTLVQAGGTGDPVGRSRVVMKQWMSHMDFIKKGEEVADGDPLKTKNMFLRDAVMHISPDDHIFFRTEDELNNVVGQEAQQKAYDGGGIFDLKGVTFGLEICLDHLDQRLLRARMPNDAQVQVQLVPSGGARIVNDNIMAGPAGLVFASDGMRGGTGMRQVYPATTIPCVTTTRVAANGSAQALEAARLFPPFFDDGNCTGQIVTYPPAPIPAAGTVPGQVRQLKWKFANGNIDFFLVYDGAGMFTRALCRMGTDGGNLNHLLYAVPIPSASRREVAGTMRCAYPVVPGLAAKQKEGTVRIIGDSNGDRYQIRCDINVDKYQFTGYAIKFRADINKGAPETVGMSA